MTREVQSLWGTLPGQRLLRLMLEGRVDEKARGKFRGLLDPLRAGSALRVVRGPRQLLLFYAEPPVVDQPWPCAVERFKAGPMVMDPPQQPGEETVAMKDLMPMKLAVYGCAMEMLSNAMYIAKELPGLDLPAQVRARIESMNETLVGTKHDLVNELAELKEIECGAADEVVMGRVERIVRWCMEDINQMHGLVEELRARADTYPKGALVCMLVTESATNILNAFAAVQDEFERLKDEARMSPEHFS